MKCPKCGFSFDMEDIVDVGDYLLGRKTRPVRPEAASDDLSGDGPFCVIISDAGFPAAVCCDDDKKPIEFRLPAEAVAYADKRSSYAPGVLGTHSVFVAPVNEKTKLMPKENEWFDQRGVPWRYRRAAQ